MLDILKESILYEYFVYKSVLNKFVEDEQILDCLIKVFQLEEKDKSDLLKLIHKDIIEEITSEADYKQYRRISQYQKMMESSMFCSEEEETIISIKGEALSTTTKKNLFAKPEMTSSLIQRNLMHYAKVGCLVAMRILGVLLCEGIFVEQNRTKGISYLEKASSWADITATLALLKYKKDAKETLAFLNSIAKDTPFEDFAIELNSTYGIKEIFYKEEIFLLKKAMAAEKMKLDEFNPMHARLVYAPAISLKDKEKIIFSENKEHISDACDLPIKFHYEDLKMKSEDEIQLLLSREKEFHTISMGLKNSDLRQLNSYHPICLVSDSNYVLEMAMRGIQQIFEENIECIEMNDLREADFEPTKNHVFVRNVNESKNTIYFLIFRGELSESVLEMGKNFLKTEKRKKFHINHPTITLDLRGVLPICICDKENAKKLKPFVETIKLANITDEEKPSIIEDMFLMKSDLYKVSEKRIDSSVVEKLCTYSLETAEKILDQAIRDFRVEYGSAELTLERMQPYFFEKNQNGNKNAYGFGGIIHENN